MKARIRWVWLWLEAVLRRRPRRCTSCKGRLSVIYRRAGVCQECVLKAGEATLRSRVGAALGQYERLFGRWLRYQRKGHSTASIEAQLTRTVKRLHKQIRTWGPLTPEEVTQLLNALLTEARTRAIIANQAAEAQPVGV